MLNEFTTVNDYGNQIKHTHKCLRCWEWRNKIFFSVCKLDEFLTHLGAQLGDVATTFADNGSSNLRARRVKRIKNENSIF